MPLYNYKALNTNSRTIRGTMTAANEVDLEHRLRGIGLDLITSKEARERQISVFSRKVELKDLIIFCIQLEQLERAGVPLLDALADLRDTAETAQLKTLMTELYEAVKGGSMLSAAMAAHPKIFDQVFIGLVAAGEKTGRLSEVFAHLSQHLKWIHYIRNKIKKATYYPAFLLLLMAGIIALMMLFVIPKLSVFLLAQNFNLPIYTKALITTSYYFQHYWYLIFGGPVIAIFLLILLYRASESFAYLIDQIKLGVPFIGPTIRKIEMARFCRFFGITFRSGIGVLDCMDIASNIVKNKVIKESIMTARKGVSEGNSLTASLKVSNQFPNLVLRMFKVGEDSGNLDATMENINFFYDREVSETVDNMIGMVQPTLTIIMGGIMLWVSLAVFGPLYSSFSQMKF